MSGAAILSQGGCIVSAISGEDPSWEGCGNPRRVLIGLCLSYTCKFFKNPNKSARRTSFFAVSPTYHNYLYV